MVCKIKLSYEVKTSNLSYFYIGVNTPVNRLIVQFRLCFNKKRKYKLKIRNTSQLLDLKLYPISELLYYYTPVPNYSENHYIFDSEFFHQTPKNVKTLIDSPVRKEIMSNYLLKIINNLNNYSKSTYILSFLRRFQDVRYNLNYT